MRVLSWLAAFEIVECRLNYIVDYQHIEVRAVHQDFDLHIQSTVGFSGFAFELTTKERDKKGRLYSVGCYSLDGSEFFVQWSQVKSFIPVIVHALSRLDVGRNHLNECFGILLTKSDIAHLKQQQNAKLNELKNRPKVEAIP